MEECTDGSSFPFLSAALATPIALAALTGGSLSGGLDRQRARFATGSRTTSATSFNTIQRLSTTICSVGEVSATLSVNVEGGPIRFRVLQDGGPVMKPGAARFTPGAGVHSFSYTFVNNTGPFEANDNHSFEVQWRSEGTPVTLTAGDLNLQFERGSQAY